MKKFLYGISTITALGVSGASVDIDSISDQIVGKLWRTEVVSNDLIETALHYIEDEKLSSNVVNKQDIPSVTEEESVETIDKYQNLICSILESENESKIENAKLFITNTFSLKSCRTYKIKFLSIILGKLI